ncbi:MAG: type II toxin-antitoxin system HicA family toxin [Thermoanaerobaculia bacterium]
MKLPRDLSGARLIGHLMSRWSYRRIHQVGSHVTLETDEPSRHRIVIPGHGSLRVGTLAAILTGVARHKGVSRDALLAGLR